MKLRIEHLAAYLPYDLQFISGHYLVGIYTGNDNKVTRPLLMSETKKGVICWEAKFDMDKPILRPLSDLTREIEHNGEKFVPIEYLWFETIGTDSDGFDKDDFIITIMHSLDIAPYKVIRKLLEWHFDIYNLIENNSAIDINTITEEANN